MLIGITFRMAQKQTIVLNNMRQYFYLIGHSIVGDDLCMDKVFMQKSDAISYGKRLANKYPEFSVVLYRQLMSNSSTETIESVKQIPSTPVEEFD